MTSDSDFTFVLWCSGCNAEQAVDQIEVYINNQWVSIDIGEQCLHRLEAEGKLSI